MRHGAGISILLIRTVLLVCLALVIAAVFLSLRRVPGSSNASIKTAPTPAGFHGEESKPSGTPAAAAAKPGEPFAGSSEAAGKAPELSGITPDDLSYLQSRNLLIPVQGVKASQLRDTFNSGRSQGRKHEAIDIMAPGGSPVLAASDGVIKKLFNSELGGITLYEQDPSGRYVYYYAHLMRYADGIAEGQTLKRGQVIAYVGDTGDAGPGNYHLHFAISKISSPRQWSGGDPIDPYPLLGGK